MLRNVQRLPVIHGLPDGKGFTLVELLVCMAIIAILSIVAIPMARGTAERGKVAQVRSDLRQIEMALTLYYDDYRNYPMVRVSCNTDERAHWCALPRELVDAGYIPADARRDVSSSMQDPFNSGHTYKYARPGPYMLNGSPVGDGFQMFVPHGFPGNLRDPGRYVSDDRSGPVLWAVWSLGPRPQKTKALHARAPISAETWYTGPGDHGVIARIGTRESGVVATP